MRLAQNTHQWFLNWQAWCKCNYQNIQNKHFRLRFLALWNSHIFAHLQNHYNWATKRNERGGSRNKMKGWKSTCDLFPSDTQENSLPKNAPFCRVPYFRSSRRGANTKMLSKGLTISLPWVFEIILLLLLFSKKAQKLRLIKTKPFHFSGYLHKLYDQKRGGKCWGKKEYKCIYQPENMFHFLQTF